MSSSDWERAEKFAVENFDLEHEPGGKGQRWFDALDPETGEKYQVKSAKPERRFRLWEDQHRSLTASEGQLGAAFYIFVTDNKPMLKVRATTVTEWVQERGGWNKAGHDLRDGRQLKIPVSWVFDRDF